MVLGDDFNGGLGTWSLTLDGALKTSSSGSPLLGANTQADRFAWKTNITLARSGADETMAQKQRYDDGATTGSGN